VSSSPSLSNRDSEIDTNSLPISDVFFSSDMRHGPRPVTRAQLAVLQHSANGLARYLPPSAYSASSPPAVPKRRITEHEVHLQ
jgi:hypothetical protein